MGCWVFFILLINIRCIDFYMHCILDYFFWVCCFVFLVLFGVLVFWCWLVVLFFFMLLVVSSVLWIVM